MPDLLEEAKRLSEAATPGPWHGVVYNDTPDREPSWCLLSPLSDLVARAFLKPADADFIARARTLIPELVERVEQAIEESQIREEMRVRLVKWDAAKLEILQEVANAILDDRGSALAAHQREVEGGY